MPYTKNKIKTTVPHKSGFDKSHRNTGSLTCGTITPILCDELIPGSRVSVRLNLATQLPPLASDTYMNLKLKAEAFFCPSRLCCASFEDWFCDNGPQPVADSSSVLNLTPRVPFFTPTTSLISNFGPGSLADYLGLKVSGSYSLGSINALPFIAYHLIWQEWYRNPRVQNPAFIRSSGYVSAGSLSTLKCAPYLYYASPDASASYEISPDLGDKSDLADSFNIFSLRQRNFGLDYFTGGRLSPQQGNAVSLNMPLSYATETSEVETTDGNIVSVPNVDGSIGFTIAALRAANSLQQFRERNNIPSPRLVDQVKARYGAILSDGVAQRPICIGTAQYSVDATGINQTGDVSSSSQNPFNSVAAQYGRAYGSGSDFIISDFTANEPGFLFVMITLVPEVTYATGTERMFKRYLTEGSITEMANPLLQNVGDQPVYTYEMVDGAPSAIAGVFCYQDRYADFMFKPNSVHGVLRDGGSLDSFVLQRSWNLPSGSSIPPTYSSAFLQIPKDYLDQVMAVSGAVSGLSAWYDCMIDYRVSMPLAEFSIPSLQDPAYEHGKPVVLTRNGQIF